MKSPLFLHPGEYFFGRHEGTVSTLLGSCVAVVLWHPRWRLLALSHYLLPNDPQARNGLDTRYGEGVFKRIHADMLRHGTRPSEYRKGLFGGASLLRLQQTARTIGPNNSAFAREQFSLRNWPVDYCDLNGQHYRRLQVDGRSGRVACLRNRVTLPAEGDA
ncbi:chemotaxis protein [Pseudomonas chlororaphis]|jgi:chemotaxis protein CheD|uniref:Chemotaxis protein CheD n=1 Tax=Pseudomonas morbosilactucae TaxID=2938197 RepID=A0A9X1YTL3_9PSED|nr:chemotaxis protein CheD [Pseudomonas morbosilactucae]MCK9797968.1 chemotaxis protein CheD [Pseudomonas morbosilactucae]MCK9812799.1 chemotaxis protein CheD [Pseudomonas morbosilactucae]ROL69397.1 chemotaxis protein [Pseudomonas chlororaphis]WEK06990.1 MAG: chemotaxis protein CheD [Pseudomonas sp.]